MREGIFAGLPETGQRFALLNDRNDKRGLELLPRERVLPLQGCSVSAPPESPDIPELCQWVVDAGLKPCRETKPALKWVASSALERELSGTSARRVGHGAESAAPGEEPVGSAAASSAVRGLMFIFLAAVERTRLCADWDAIV